jgi:hypothetical protein
VKITRLARDNPLSRVMQMVAEAQSQQSPTQQFTERFTARFVPVVLVLVALVAALPPLFGWMPFAQSFYRAMLLLVAASPCALAVGAPAAVLAGIAQAARNGVLIKGGVHLENLGRLNAIAFDKTRSTALARTRCCAWPGRWNSSPTIRWRWPWCRRRENASLPCPPPRGWKTSPARACAARWKASRCGSARASSSRRALNLRQQGWWMAHARSWNA